MQGLRRVPEGLLEFAWLVTLLAVPIYFNVDDVRAFEPDKAYLLRDCAALIAVLALLAFALRLLCSAVSADLPRNDPPGPRSVSRASWRFCRRRPTLLPMLALAAVVLLATAASILPSLSWYGSYARAQGALTTLAYLVVGLAVLAFLRRPGQVERLGTAIALSGVAPACYGWVQHFGADPLRWQQSDLSARVPGTMGNPIFLGALLVMTIPLAAYRLLLAVRPQGTILPPAADPGAAPLRASGTQPGHAPAPVPSAEGTASRSRPSASFVLQPRFWIALGWAAILIVEGGALIFTKSRGPFAGLLAGLAVFAASLSFMWHLHTLRRLVGPAAVAAAAVLLAVSLLGHGSQNGTLRLLQWNPAASGSSEVRLDIWGPALSLIPKRPLLGCGPDALTFCYYPVYPTSLRHVEAPNAMPDRMHNMFLDAAVETGLLGLAALLALLGVTLATLARLARLAATPRQRLFAAAALAALAGHVVEGFFGIEIVATQLLTWLICGAAGAMAVMAADPATAGESAVVTASEQPLPSGRGRRGSRAAGGRHAAATRPRPDSVRRVAAALVLAACVAALFGGWRVVRLGASATSADLAAAGAADLERAALGNSGQQPLPPGVHAQPILALRQFAAAVALRNQAIADAPFEEEYLLDAGTTYVNWAQAAADQGEVAAQQAPDLYVQALVDFGKAARMNPYNPDHLRNTGKAYERWAGLGHDASLPATWNQALLQRAADAFARAAELAPHHPDPLTSWAEVAIWQSRPAQAISLADRALALDPRDGDGYRLRAQAELALNRRQAALADWRRALADPQVEHRGETAASLALAEATWAHQRCRAVADAGAALAAGSVTISGTASMHEIVHVDGPLCPHGGRSG